MKTKTIGLLALPVIAAIMVVGSFAQFAMADPATVVTDSIGCNPVYTTIWGYSTYTPTEEQGVSTNNARANSSIHCMGQLDDLSSAPATAEITVLDPCFYSEPNGAFVVGTGNLVVTPTGHVSITCNSG